MFGNSKLAIYLASGHIDSPQRQKISFKSLHSLLYWLVLTLE